MMPTPIDHFLRDFREPQLTESQRIAILEVAVSKLKERLSALENKGQDE